MKKNRTSSLKEKSRFIFLKQFITHQPTYLHLHRLPTASKKKAYKLRSLIMKDLHRQSEVNSNLSPSSSMKAAYVLHGLILMNILTSVTLFIPFSCQECPPSISFPCFSLPLWPNSCRKHQFSVSSFHTQTSHNIKTDTDFTNAYNECYLHFGI